MLFVFAALIVLVTSQCNPEGNTYSTEDGRSLTFGKAVGDWLPGLLTVTTGSVSFATWTQDTATRWLVKDFSSSGTEWFCDKEGQYTLEFFNACAELHFTVLEDICGDRASLLSNVFTLDVPSEADCASSGTQLTTHFSVAKDFPRLSGDMATVIFGMNRYALVSVATRAVIVQRWRLTSGSEDTIEIVDLASFPTGYACDQANIGMYVTNWQEGCSARICFSEDACPMRAELFHDIATNDFGGDMCTRAIPEDELHEHCSTGKQWLRHPEDCIAQEVPGGCMFCSGIAMGVTTQWCLDRQGAGCEQVFESTAAHAYCNLAFECPAAPLGASLALFICSILALFLHQ